MSITRSVSGTGPDMAEPPVTDRSSEVSRKVAGSALQLMLRRLIVTVLSALSTAVLARRLGVAEFGGYSAGLASYYLLLAFGDFGFGLVLARELGRGRPNDGRTTRAMIQIQSCWSAALVVLAAVVAFAAGIHSTRSEVLLVMTPALALQGIAGIRQVFYALYRTRRLGLIDVATNAAQALLIIALALAGTPPTAIAAAFSLMVVVNAVLIFREGRTLLDAGRPDRALRGRLVRDAAPLGLSSVLASAYFMLDLVVIGFIVGERQLGYYAASVKILSILVTVPVLLMTAALPGISGRAQSPGDLGALAARLWHWLAAFALPLCMGAIIFAGTAVDIFFGPGFGPAVVLVRIVSASAVVALLSNVLGTVMVAQRRTRWILGQNACALVLNLGGNLLLVPRFGVAASAWLTLATEVFVCAGSALGLRGALVPGPLLRATVAPAVATLAMVAVGVALAGWPWVAIPASVIGFLVVLVALGGWPEEIRVPGSGRLSKVVTR